MNTNISLISEHLPYFRVIVRRSLPARYMHLAEDLAQDAIIKSIENLAKYDPSKGNFRSWIYRLTQNMCFDMIRKMDRMDVIVFDLSQVKEDGVTFSLGKEDIKKLRKAIQQLPERDRMLITYKFFFDLSSKEIAGLIQLPEKQVNVYMMRAKKKLFGIYSQAA
jgi:RNA polymerase sigma-70 factor (ECF subfamily)